MIPLVVQWEGLEVLDLILMEDLEVLALIHLVVRWEDPEVLVILLVDL